MSPGRRRMSTWTAPGRRETVLVCGLLITLFFIFQSNLSIRYSASSAADDDYLSSSSSSSWSWNSNSNWFSGSKKGDLSSSSGKAKSDGSKVLPSIQGARGDGLTMNDVTVSWKGANQKMPQTTMIQHSEGFTIFDNIYAHNGTLYIISDSPKSFPEIRTMISSGYPVFNGDDEVKKREPTAKDMQVISVKEAERRFGKLAHRLEGVTFMSNDPPQFINHYYHFAAELLFGIWRAYTSLDPSIKSSGQTVLPPPRRF
ncbi:hypothetical protein FRB90_008882, partial [Tulasnella sp. 427]